MLYACYDLIPLNVVMELSWRKHLEDFSMPFIINYMSEMSMTVDRLNKENEERKAREVQTKTEEDNTPILGGSRLMLTQGPAGNAPTPMPYQQTNGFTPQPTGYRGQF